jgi:hypothetical protein
VARKPRCISNPMPFVYIASRYLSWKIVGLFTALPANAWLIRKGWKEKMPPVEPQQMQKFPAARASGCLNLLDLITDAVAAR